MVGNISEILKYMSGDFYSNCHLFSQLGWSKKETNGCRRVTDGEHNP